MQRSNNEVLFSATDLTHFAECQHLSWLDRLNLDHRMEAAEDDAQAILIQQKGYAHEAQFFEKEKSQCPSWIEIKGDSLEARIETTAQAIRDGVELIFQGVLRRGNLTGTADFLMRVPGADIQYEVADTKLARSTKAKFLLQLCFYSDLLSDLTGKLPVSIHVELGSGKRETFRVADYFYYYLHLRDQFLAYIDTYPEAAPPYPVPCEHCTICRWRDRCAEQRLTDDHLSAVANIRQQQIVRLEAAGIKTVVQLAELAPSAKIKDIAEETLTKLREQARLQMWERTTGEARVDILELNENEVRGFDRLPLPDRGDLFFDMEGDPIEDGGLEYLFGVYYFDDGQPQFTAFWAHDRAEERQAFIDFMNFVEARIARFPSAHIYHYAHYENTALKRLMTSHGVKESAVDQLLREHRLVDLYKVVREALRISKDSYSIKSVESFYAEKRSADVKKASDSIVVYEQWRESRDPALLESIRVYNEDDCRSTWQLREWLLTLRPSHAHRFNAAAVEDAKAAASAAKKSEKTLAHESMLERFHERLITAPENPALDPSLAELVFQLLDFHRRADKPGWWSTFDRKEAEFEDLIDDMEVIAGLHSPQFIDCDEGSIYRYHYPAQEFKIKAGDPVARLDNLKEATVVAIDEKSLTINLEMRLGKEPAPPELLSIALGKPINNDVMRDAVVAYANALCQGSEEFKAATEFLRRTIPDIATVPIGSPLIDAAEDTVAQAINVVSHLNNSYAFIQGPPGTGKTYTGSHIIADLLARGKRIAVSSNSHKAINNLLNAVDKRMKERGVSYRGMKKVGQKGSGEIQSDFIVNVGSYKPMEQEKPDLIAGTAWAIARPEFRGEFDYLFIDEAGQVSLANTIAMAMCAKNLVLLGDQMQLGQPIQGSHPGRSGESALEYLLAGEHTIAPERGIFLDKSFRMHPDICGFISDAIYDGRLKSDESTFQQALVLNNAAHPLLMPTGIRFVPLEHDGCSQKSEEEAALIAEIFENLLTQHHRDKSGNVKPITLDDILVVAPYNMQVNLLKNTLPEGARVGTVDKFQGQEAEVVLISMATSSQEYMPRNIEFLFSKNRLNVAISRAKLLSFFILSSELLSAKATSLKVIPLINTLSFLKSGYSQ